MDGTTSRRQDGPDGPDGPPEELIDQIVFRWDAANRSGNTGFGPVAWSCARSQVQDLFRSSVAPLLRGNFSAADGPDASGLVRVEQHGQGNAMLLRRTPHRDPGGRPGTLCHALIGPAQVLDPDTCIGLDSWAWSDEFFGDTDWGEVRGELPRIPGQALRDSALRGYAQLVDEVDGSGSEAARPLVAAAAELLRHPKRVQMLLDRDGGRSACRTLMGLYGIFSGIFPDRWTYATRDTAESTLIRFAFVRRWPGSAAPDTQRTRVDPDEGRGDHAEELAAHLVGHYLARVGRQSRMFEVADALGHAAETYRSASVDADHMHRTAERALRELERQQADEQQEFERRQDVQLREERARQQELARLREREELQARALERRLAHDRELELELERERNYRRENPARPTAAYPAAPYPSVSPPAAAPYPSVSPPPASPPPAAPPAAAPLPAASYPASSPRSAAPPESPSEGPPSEGPPSEGPPPDGPHPRAAGQPEPSAADWAAPTGARRGRPVWRRKPSLQYGDLLDRLGPLDERSPDEARRQVVADLPEVTDADLLRAVHEDFSYPATTLLVREAAVRWPHWKEATRLQLCRAVLDVELFLPRWQGPAGTYPGDEKRAANAAALYRWAVQPLAGQDGPSARLTELLPALRTGPDPAARAAVRQILEEGELPGLREEVWRALLTRGREPRGSRSAGPDRPPPEGVPHAAAARPSVPSVPAAPAVPAASSVPSGPVADEAAPAAPAVPAASHEDGYERRIRNVLILVVALVAVFLTLLVVWVVVAL
ncbi:hypothetical protein ACH4SP_05675 [Streptomyces sp. NPDC021093]|uniref:hypothetical protein n=1 Tax=Streptomyces sp. NPDC021093 TaxID=3365112 RepID=UPI0037A46F56